jgi:hypothetical protein
MTTLDGCRSTACDRRPHRGAGLARTRGAHQPAHQGMDEPRRPGHQGQGMFVRPEQIAEIGRRHPELGRLRLVVTRDNEQDASGI